MSRRLGAMLVMATVTLFTGCVERRFRIESTPPGAAVYVNNVPYGSAPVDIPFTYYGTYNITLVKDGFQTKQIQQEISAPWYQYPPIDFVAESLWPWQVTDIRPLRFEMEPLTQPNLDQIKRDADELRQRSKGLPAPRYPELDRKEKPNNDS